MNFVCDWLLKWLFSLTPHCTGTALLRPDIFAQRRPTKGGCYLHGLKLQSFSYQMCGPAARLDWSGEACSPPTDNSYRRGCPPSRPTARRRPLRQTLLFITISLFIFSIRSYSPLSDEMQTWKSVLKKSTTQDFLSRMFFFYCVLADWPHFTDWHLKTHCWIKLKKLNPIAICIKCLF